MSWFFLSLAIAFEVFATLSLRLLALGRRRWLPVVIGGYVISFSMLSLTLRFGMPLGVAYGIWTATGVGLIALAGRVLFAERLSRTTMIGLACIGAGVLLVELGH